MLQSHSNRRTRPSGHVRDAKENHEIMDCPHALELSATARPPLVGVRIAMSPMHSTRSPRRSGGWKLPEGGH